LYQKKIRRILTVEMEETVYEVDDVVVSRSTGLRGFVQQRITIGRRNQLSVMWEDGNLTQVSIGGVYLLKPAAEKIIEVQSLNNDQIDEDLNVDEELAAENEDDEGDDEGEGEGNDDSAEDDNEQESLLSPTQPFDIFEMPDNVLEVKLVDSRIRWQKHQHIDQCVTSDHHTARVM
jgi:hypothetical protein